MKPEPIDGEWFMLTWDSAGSPQIVYSDKRAELEDMWDKLTQNGKREVATLWKRVLPDLTNTAPHKELLE